MLDVRETGRPHRRRKAIGASEVLLRVGTEATSMGRMMNAMPMPQMPMPQMSMPMMGMPMPMGMMGGMPGMMPMPMMMMPMPMPMGMMGGMGMPNQMMGMMGMPGMMPMQPMMCRMTCEMTKDGMVCKMMPMDAAQMEMMKERCTAMMSMMAMGMPC